MGAGNAPCLRLAKPGNPTLNQACSFTGMTEQPIILFDGVCHLCDRSVQFVLARDPQEQFCFAALQSDIGRQLLEKAAPEAMGLNSVVLIVDGVAYLKSDAALRIAARLSGAWPLLRVFLLVPRPVRDWAYDWVARNRYRWFGRSAACWVPAPKWRRRFLS